ncbi:phage tail protein [Burkholderia cenocepacia]|uniref:phage tail protein n=1 Tax=Burkholderia cenocepacia TaxID=95486 RepID=UPI002859930F|nr:phage tail protein [Burkholderia cenocepacia]MDR8049865.1 phage tail protein [Burkholderia cenocepacia]
MDLLKIEIDVRGALEALAGLPPAAMQAAWRRTLRKTGAWIRSQTAKEVSGATGIQQKLLRQRMYFFMRSLDTGKVWLGLNPIEAHRLGAVRRTKKGMRAGKSLFEGAWRKTKAQPDGAIYRRIGKARTPFEVVTVEWAQTGDPAFRRAARACEARLMTVLRQEVNYEIQKAANRAR